MKGQHVDPEEAVQIHVDLQAKHSVAIHWGTFALAYEVGGAYKEYVFGYAGQDQGNCDVLARRHFSEMFV